MTAVYLGLGSNQGRRQEHLAAAVREFGRWPGTTVRGVSSLYESEYLGPGPEQDRYLNACVELESDLDPMAILRASRHLESVAGRATNRDGGPRPLDIDVLLYGREEIQRPELVVPHPRMRERRFVLQPLADLTSQLRLPPGQEPISDLVRRPAVRGQGLHTVDAGSWWQSEDR